MSRLRRLAFPLHLAVVRVRRRGGRLALVALGLAAAAGVVATVLGWSLVAQDEGTEKQIAALPGSVRAIRAASFGVLGQSTGYVLLDRQARGAVTPLLGRQPVATVLYRESTIAGSFIALGGVDGLARYVTLRSGRLPGACRPSRCEVLQLRGRELPPSKPGLRLVRVGFGDIGSTTLFGDAIAPAQNALYQAALSEQYRRASRYHEPPIPPFYLAEGVTGLATSPVLKSTYRTFAWVSPIQPGDVHPWSGDQLVADVERARSTLQASSYTFDLRAPSDEIASAVDHSRVAGRRLLLLGGEAAALLLAFAALAAARLRPEAEATERRLVWLGAPRLQTAAVVTVEAAVVTLVAAAIGWAIGAAIVALIARARGEAAGAVLAHSVVGFDGLAVGAVLALAATVVVVAALLLRPLRFSGRALSPLDVAAVAAVAIVVVALARGAADPAALAEERGTGVLLLLLPALVAFAAGIAAARLLGPSLRLLERVTPAGWLSLRLAVLALARRPGYAAAAVAFLTVSGGLAFFCATYRTTLVESQSEQASFAVPADYVLREDLRRLIAVRGVATPQALHVLGPGARSYPVTRQSSSIGGSITVTGITVLGVEPDLIPTLDGWRDDFSDKSQDELARLISVGDAAFVGAQLPPRADTVSLRVRTRGSPYRLTVVVEGPNGAFDGVRLGSVKPGSQTLAATLPRPLRGGRVVALSFDQPPRQFERGANAGTSAESVTLLGPLAAGGEVVSDYADWRSVAGARVLTRTKRGVRLALTLNEAANTYFRPRQATDGLSLPVVASPHLAALGGNGGKLLLTIAGESVPVRVVAVADHFPGTKDDLDFAVTSRSALVTALNTARPGVGTTTEVWVQAPPSAEARVGERLRRPPFHTLLVDSRSAHENALTGDPIARASLAMLVVAAAFALGLAVIGVLIGAIAEVRDERGELHELETLGLGPARLRRQTALRSGLALGFGLLGAIVTGLVLSTLVVGVVDVTANASPPVPPLELVVDWPLLVLATLLAVVASLVAVALVATRAFRGPETGRYAEA
jgi:FtsX-like permease family protein